MKQFAQITALLFGLMLIAKRSPAELDQWFSQVGTFVFDPENFAGLVLVTLGVINKKRS